MLPNEHYTLGSSYSSMSIPITKSKSSISTSKKYLNVMYLSFTLVTVPWLPSILVVEALAFSPQLPLSGYIQLVFPRSGKGFGPARPLLLYKYLLSCQPLICLPSLKGFHGQLQILCNLDSIFKVPWWIYLDHPLQWLHQSLYEEEYLLLLRYVVDHNYYLLKLENIFIYSTLLSNICQLSQIIILSFSIKPL